MHPISVESPTQLMHAAISAGVIKFNGPATTPEKSREAAAADAAYLLAMFTKLTVPGASS